MGSSDEFMRNTVRKKMTEAIGGTYNGGFDYGSPYMVDPNFISSGGKGR